MLWRRYAFIFKGMKCEHFAGSINFSLEVGKMNVFVFRIFRLLVIFLSQTSFSGVLSIYASFCLVAILIGENLGKTLWQFVG